MGLKAVASSTTGGQPGTFTVLTVTNSAAIANPTLTGAISGVPGLLAKCGIPFIGLSSGSVAANGAISGITALPTTYARAYCYFPANALATSIAAGWYYCTFSSTTAGTAFLNTYTSGVPTIPASPTPVTDGRGAFTGDTGEEFGPQIAIAANLLGATGGIRSTTTWTCNNTANVKTGRTRFSGTAGTAFLTAALANSLQGGDIRTILNRGVATAQVGPSPLLTGPITSFAGGATYGTADTTQATTLVHSLQRATATDNLVLESFFVETIA